MAQGLQSPGAALAFQARSAIFGTSSAPLIGSSRATATGTCRPRSSFSWRCGPAAEPVVTPCRMTQRLAFSRPLPPPPPHSPKLRPGLSQHPQAPVPLRQLHGPSPGHVPWGPCTTPTPPYPRLPQSARPRGPSPHHHLQRCLSSPDPRGVCGAQCLLPCRVSAQHAARGMQHAARGSMGALTIEAISAASLPQRVTASCSTSPQKLPGAPGTPICSVPAAWPAPNCWPPGPGSLSAPRWQSGSAHWQQVHFT